MWIYTGGDVDSILVEYADDLKDFRSVENDKVWDVAGQTMDAWFADRKTEPDTLIQDFCSVVGHENPASLIPHQLTFLRHIDDAIASPAVCVDETAPLEKLGSECTLIEPESPKEDPTEAPEDAPSSTEAPKEDPTEAPKEDPTSTEAPKQDPTEATEDDSSVSVASAALLSIAVAVTMATMMM